MACDLDDGEHFFSWFVSVTLTPFSPKEMSMANGRGRERLTLQKVEATTATITQAVGGTRSSVRCIGALSLKSTLSTRRVVSIYFVAPITRLNFILLGLSGVRTTSLPTLTRDYLYVCPSRWMLSMITRIHLASTRPPLTMY